MSTPSDYFAEDDCWYDARGRFETIYDVVGRMMGRAAAEGLDRYWEERFRSFTSWQHGYVEVDDPALVGLASATGNE